MLEGMLTILSKYDSNSMKIRRMYLVLCFKVYKMECMFSAFRQMLIEHL